MCWISRKIKKKSPYTGDKITIIFSTLGFNPDALTPLISYFPEVKKVIFYYSSEKKKQAVDAKKEVVRVCRAVGIDCQAIELKNYVDMVPMIKRMRSDIRKYDRKEIIFNITGGTKAMAGAGIIASILEGVKLVFNDWENERIVEYPILKMRYEDTLTKKEKEILKYILKKGECRFSDIIEDIGISKSTVSHHLDRLEEKGFIERIPAKDSKREKIIRAKEVAELI